MKTIIMSIVVACFCAMSFFPEPAEATLITIAVEAVVDSVQDEGNYLEGKVEAGDIITGFYVYESTTPDSSPLDPVQGNYWHYASPAGIALTVGGFNFMSDPFNLAFHVATRNNSSGDDSYWLATQNNLPLSNGTPVDYISWSLRDYTSTALSSDALPTTAPLLNQWQGNRLRMYADRMWGVEAHVTSAVLEPSSFLLLALGGFLFRKRA